MNILIHTSKNTRISKLQNASEQVGLYFDNYYTSEYVRALETAALLNLPQARWNKEFYLREQDKGILGGKKLSDLEAQFGELLQKTKKDGIFLFISFEVIFVLCWQVFTSLLLLESQLQALVYVSIEYYKNGEVPRNFGDS